MTKRESISVHLTSSDKSLGESLTDFTNLVLKLSHLKLEIFSKFILEFYNGEMILDLENPEIHEIVIQDFIDRQKEYYQELDGVEIDRDFKHSIGYTFYLNIFNKNNELCMKCQFVCFGATKTLGGISFFYDNLFSNFSELTIFFTEILDCFSVEYGNASNVKFFLDCMNNKELHKYLRLYIVGSITYLSNERLLGIDLTKCPPNIDKIFFNKGVGFSCSSNEIFNPQNHKHLQNSFLLREYFLSNNLFEY
jgi:hypothetical protein